MKILTAFVVFIVLVIGLFLGFIYSGIYNIAASEPHFGAVRWVLHTTMMNSVRYHARDIVAPPLSDPSLVDTGFRHYQETCVQCHGAPGVEPSELGKGLTPPPPKLTKEGHHAWTPAELFWIVKHGIKMTGMPAWGATHKDDELWAIVAFMQQLPELSPEEYQAMKQTAGASH
jgi:mono/diheme cytochrome c family protein